MVLNLHHPECDDIIEQRWQRQLSYNHRDQNYHHHDYKNYITQRRLRDRRRHRLHGSSYFESCCVSGYNRRLFMVLILIAKIITIIVDRARPCN